MRTYKNGESLEVITQPTSDEGWKRNPLITIRFPMDQPALNAGDKINMGTQLGTTGTNAGYPVDVFLEVQEITHVHFGEDSAEVIAKVIRQEL